MLRRQRHLSAAEEDDFNVVDMKEIAGILSGTTQLMTSLLSAVAGIGLLVGGVGIMNIMLVSVAERTRKIGIRLAIGALESEILMQFLVEAVVLSSTGGLIGIILALIIAILLAAIGIVFGYAPARKAARLNPIEALRHE